jgi:hypothetical protein
MRVKKEEVGRKRQVDGIMERAGIGSGKRWAEG